MNKTEVVKFFSGIVVAAGTSKIVAGIIRNNTSPENLKNKVAIIAASVVVGSMVATAARKHTNEMIDETIESYTQIKEHVNRLRENLNNQL